MKRTLFLLLVVLSPFLLWHCQPETTLPSPASIQEVMIGVESIQGNNDYLDSPFVTAGDRVYMVGHQNGQFPGLGWHVKGEMGGIWDHPIKLMDGFTASINASYCLHQADSFINYPFANKHLFLDGPNNLRIERFQFVPDGKEGLYIEYVFTNNSSTDLRIGLDLTAFSDLRPVWLGERTGMEDGEDYFTWNNRLNAWVGKDSLNEWYTIFGSGIEPQSIDRIEEGCDYSPSGNGAKATIHFDLPVKANSYFVLPVTIAGSYTSRKNAASTYKNIQNNALRLLQAKKERYSEIAQTARLTIPDKKMERAFRWIKYNTDWLIRDVPEVGRGLSAGIPDYPWWFGVDNEYTLQGAISMGQKDIVYETIDLIHQISEKTNGNGRIIHEVSTNGAVFNPGNINETPQFASLIWEVYQWTGDSLFLQKYFPTVKKGLTWLFEERDADGNLLPDGFGMMEIHGLDSEMIDVAVYTQKALDDAAEMAKELGETELASDYKEKAIKLRQVINKDFWVPEFNSYADFIGTTEQAIHLIDDAIVRADTLEKPWAVEELKRTKARISQLPPGQKQGFVVHHNWVVNTPMEVGVADRKKAVRALETGSRFVNPFGVFVTGIDRDETAGKEDGSFAADKKVFSYTGAVMTLPTGVQAIAENNYGRPDKALDYLQRMTRTFSFALPGSMYEVSPDFGMMTQAWNLYSYAVPIVQQFFGIQPEAADSIIYIMPQMPSEWQEASIENVKIGENKLSLFYQQVNETVKLTIDQSEEGWELIIGFPIEQFQDWILNGKVVAPEKIGEKFFLFTKEKQVELELK